jgi:hypothetical protein
LALFLTVVYHPIIQHKLAIFLPVVYHSIIQHTLALFLTVVYHSIIQSIRWPVSYCCISSKHPA